MQELRAAISAFSDVKPSLAWAETYPGTLSYYLASAFREVWMQPSGTVGLIGFATNAMFLRDALDKVGIEAQFVARGEYKSVANRFTQDSYTDSHREADTRLIESLHAQVWQAVAESRHLESSEVDALADKAPLLRDDAVTGRLVDRIGFRDEAYARIGELVGAPGISPETGDADSEDAPPRLYLSRYAKATASRPSPPMPSVPGRKGKPTIAVVTLHGPIVSGRGGRRCCRFGNSSAGGDTIAAALREAAADDSVSAIVLRVDSPGGSVTGSETVWREVDPGPRRRETGRRVDGCRRGLGRLLRVDVRRRDRGQRGNHHRFDRRRDRQAGRPRAQGPPRRGLRFGAHQRQRRRMVDQPAVHRRAARACRSRGRPVLHRLRRAGRRRAAR